MILYASTWLPPVCCCHKPNSIFKEILKCTWGAWVKSQWALYSWSPSCSLTHNTCWKECANLSLVRRGCKKETIKNNGRFHCSFKQDMARVILYHSYRTIKLVRFYKKALCHLHSSHFLVLSRLKKTWFACHKRSIMLECALWSHLFASVTVFLSTPVFITYVLG